MKLKSISIENYRFFKDKQDFNFTSKENKPQNILLYGENGSGKTSLYNALLDFFFYYKNESKSRNKLQENKNIFCQTTDNPKINVVFENDILLSFTETGFDKADLKEKIEEVSKSKLFLTYQDIYNLNSIFKKDISYKEFKEILLILFYETLNEEFEQFEKSLEILEKSIFENKNKLAEIFEDTKKIIFDFKEKYYKLELNDIEKSEISEIYDKVFYLSDNYILKFEEAKVSLEKFLNICSNNKVLDISTYEIIEKFDDIIGNLSTYTLENDRYEKEEHTLGITIVDKKELDDIQSIDKFLSHLEENTELASSFIECEEKADLINKLIYDEFNSKLEKINEILNFLDINIELKRVKKIPYIKFNLNYIFHKNINNIDFEILLSDVELKSHWNNLNEAKLSALNLAIYFSSVLGKKPTIPILVLDDLLISLDMSNRDKVLNLLLDRSEDNRFFDNHYQMFIFTHDRAFFELAKYRFDSKASGEWKYFEMYENNSEKISVPLLIPFENNLDKAVSYFKLCNYPVAGNYLRKASEEIIRDKLLETYIPLPKDGLDKYIQQYEKQCKDFNIDISQHILELKELTYRILNPSSHDDLISPIYKKEISDAIKLVKKIKDIPIINIGDILFKTGAHLIFKYNDVYISKYILLGDFKLYTFDDNVLNRDNLLFCKQGFKIKENEEWEETIENNSQTLNLNDIYKRNKNFLNKKFQDKTFSKEDFVDNLSIGDNQIPSDIRELFLKQLK